MPRIYQNVKENFPDFDHFKDTATKTLNEIYGRVKPFDVIDFSYNETHYIAIGYYEGETIPEEQKSGEPLSKASARDQRVAKAMEEENRKIAAKELADEETRIKAKYAAQEPVTYEELLMAAKLGIPLPEGIAVQLTEGVRKGTFSFEAAHAAGLTHIDGVPTLEAATEARKAGVVNIKVAEQNADAAKAELPAEKKLPPGVKQVGDKIISDKAHALAIEKGVDITKIEGTGRDGTIKIDDVKNHIPTTAPAKENADGNTDEQSNA